MKGKKSKARKIKRKRGHGRNYETFSGGTYRKGSKAYRRAFHNDLCDGGI